MPAALASSIESSPRARSGPAAAAGRGSGRIGSASSHSAMRCAAHPTHGRLPSTVQALGVLAEISLLLSVTVQVAAFDVAVSIKLANQPDFVFCVFVTSNEEEDLRLLHCMLDAPCVA